MKTQPVQMGTNESIVLISDYMLAQTSILIPIYWGFVHDFNLDILVECNVRD